MTLIKKADVPAYRAARQSSGLHLVAEPVKVSKIHSPKSNQAVEATPPTFADDFSGDHSAPGGTVSAIVFPVPANELHPTKAAEKKHS